MKKSNFYSTSMKALCVLIIHLFTLNNCKAQAIEDTLLIPTTLGLALIQIRDKIDVCTNINGDMWIALKSKGIVHYNGGNWANITNANTSGQLPNDSITKVHYDVNGNLWIGSKYGLTKKSGLTYSNYPYNIAPDFLKSPINAIATLGQEVFLGSDTGLIIFNTATSNWSRFHIGNSGLLSNKINSLSRDPNGKIWIGTNNGFSIFNSGTIISFAMSNSMLPDSNIIDIAITPFDTILLAKNFGIIRFDGTNFIWLDNLHYGRIVPSFCVVGGLVNLGWENKSVKQGATLAIDPQNRIYYIRKVIPGNYDGVNLLCIDHLKQMFYSKMQSNFHYSAGTGAYNIFLRAMGQDSIILFAGGIVQPYRFITIETKKDTTYKELLLKAIPQNGAVVLQRNIPPSYIGNELELLEGNMVRAMLTNQGDLHWDPIGQVPYYEVPKGSNRNSVFASSFWIGGLDAGNNLYTAAQTYRQSGSNDFWPGPLDTNGQSTAQSNADFNHIWMARRSDIDEFRFEYSLGNVQNGSYPVPSFILDWPAFYNDPAYPQRLAPFVDFNNDNLYNPLDGDYPDVKGDQMAWWVFNDNGLKTETNSPIMGLEVQASAYSINCVDTALANIAVSYTTYYHYDVYNRSNVDYHSCYLGMWSDFDLGNAGDDYVGCDLASNSFFVYNGDPDDDGGSGYGLCPPTQNVSFLKGPLAPLGDGIDNNHDGVIDESGEELGLSGFQYYENVNNVPFGNMAVTDDYYEYLTGRWADGLDVTFGGNGRGAGPGATNIPTKFMYSGSSDPAFSSHWTMGTSATPPTDMRGVGSMGPFSLAAGDSASFDIAFFTGPYDTLSNQAMTLNLRNQFRSGFLNTMNGNISLIQGPTFVSGAGTTSTYSMPLPSGTNIFLWTVQNGVIINGQGTNSITVLWGVNGIGNVAVEVIQGGNPCKNSKNINVQIGSGVAIHEVVDEIVVRIYPNPTKGFLNIESENNKIEFVRIINMQGRVLSNESFNGRVNTDALTSGVYILELIGGSKKALVRKMFIKQ